MSLSFKWSFFFFFSFSTKSPPGNSGSFSGRSRPGIKIPLTSCSGATCCHSSSSSLLYFFSPPPPLLLQPSSFISIPPTAFCLLITVSFQAIAGSPHPLSPLLHLLPFPLCDFFFSFSAYVATSVFTLRARRNLPPNCFHHEYFMISGPISHRRHVVLYSAAAAACQRPSPFPQL